MNIFEKRVRCKPYEYPDVIRFRDVIRESRWHAEEFDFGEDIQDFKVHLNDQERNVIKNTMLAISQVEVESVKTFWSNIGEWLGKPEIAMVGTTFGENEITHFEAYSMLLEKLGFNEEFERLLENEVIADRINYLSKYLRGSGDNVQEFNTLKLALFSLFVENVSLFGQFLVIKSFNKKKKKLKSIDNVVLATQKDELCHAQFGVELLRIIKSENPDWFNEAFYAKIERACKKAFEAECRIIDWIFEQGDLDFLTAFDVKEFLKRRFNSSLEDIGASKIFTDIDEASREKTKWFDEEIIAYIRNDFFDTKSTNYNKKIVTRKDIKNAVKRFRKEYGMV